MKEFLFLFMVGLIIIILGIHEIDLAFNMSTSANCIDTSLGGLQKDKVQMHMQGMQEVLLGMFFMMFAFLGVLKI